MPLRSALFPIPLHSRRDPVSCFSFLSNFRAHFTRVKQVGQVEKSMARLPYRRLGGRREQLTERDREHALA